MTRKRTISGQTGTESRPTEIPVYSEIVDALEGGE